MHHLEVPDPLVTFEPGSHAFDAAVALCQCADVSLLISDFAGEQLYAKAGKTSAVLPTEFWLSAGIDDIASRLERAVVSTI